MFDSGRLLRSLVAIIPVWKIVLRFILPGQKFILHHFQEIFAQGKTPKVRNWGSKRLRYELFTSASKLALWRSHDFIPKNNSQFRSLCLQPGGVNPSLSNQVQAIPLQAQQGLSQVPDMQMQNFQTSFKVTHWSSPGLSCVLWQRWRCHVSALRFEISVCRKSAGLSSVCSRSCGLSLDFMHFRLVSYTFAWFRATATAACHFRTTCRHKRSSRATRTASCQWIRTSRPGSTSSKTSSIPARSTLTKSCRIWTSRKWMTLTGCRDRIKVRQLTFFFGWAVVLLRSKSNAKRLFLVIWKQKILLFQLHISVTREQPCSGVS